MDPFAFSTQKAPWKKDDQKNRNSPADPCKWQREDSHGWNIAVRHKFVQSINKTKKQPASTEGKIGAGATTATGRTCVQAEKHRHSSLVDMLHIANDPVPQQFAPAGNWCTAFHRRILGNFPSHRNHSGRSFRSHPTTARTDFQVCISRSQWPRSGTTRSLPAASRIHFFPSQAIW